MGLMCKTDESVISLSLILLDNGLKLMDHG